MRHLQPEVDGLPTAYAPYIAESLKRYAEDVYQPIQNPVFAALVVLHPNEAATTQLSYNWWESLNELGAGEALLPHHNEYHASRPLRFSSRAVVQQLTFLSVTILCFVNFTAHGNVYSNNTPFSLRDLFSAVRLLQYLPLPFCACEDARDVAQESLEVTRLSSLLRSVGLPMPVLVTGLHACESLSPAVLRSFTHLMLDDEDRRNRCASVIVFVGCCYNQMSEAGKHPYYLLSLPA